jgi:hypothetical protein
MKLFFETFHQDPFSYPVLSNIVKYLELTGKNGCMVWLLDKMAPDKLNKSREHSCDNKSSDLKDLVIESVVLHVEFGFVDP